VDKIKLQALQMTKEIVVKFVETGRITPSNFTDHFSRIYHEVLRTISRDEAVLSGNQDEAAAGPAGDR